MSNPLMSHAPELRPVGFVLLGLSNVMAWAEGFNAGAVASGITAVGLALVGLGIWAWKQFDATKLESRLKWDAAMKGSLSEQVAILVEQGKESARRVEDANRKLHDIRDEANTDRLRHHEEIDRLVKQLQLAQDQLDQMAKDLRFAVDERDSLKDLVKGLGSIALNTQQTVKDVKATVEAATGSNSDHALPTFPPDPRPGPGR